MKKKIIMTLLSVVSVFNLLAGCGSNTVGGDIPVRDEIADTQEENVEEVVELSKENSQDVVDIDYNIATYQPVQEFGFSLFKENIQETNPVLSPVSAYIALTMASEGAEGNTKQEFQNVLGAKEDMTVMSYSMMHTLPQDTESLTVELANSAWIDNEFTVKDEWIGKITSFYDAQAFQTDVSSVEAMNAINEWVESNTHELIQQMIEKPLEKETRMVLFNTLYFNGKWQNPFMLETTFEEEFHVSDSETIQVPMMHQYDENYEFFENDYLKGIVMPYRDGNLSFVAMLPQGDRTIREVAANLSASGLSDILSERAYQIVNIKLPKFEVSFDKILNESLQDMGLVDAFDEEKADFSSIGTTDSGYPIYISLVRQKAVVKVDEEGTEAAAATEVAIMESAALLEEEPIEMYFDQPFLYMIMDMETELPLFMGIMDNPMAK